MKIWLLFIVVLLVAAIMSGCIGKPQNTDEIDGGVIIDDGVDAPKTITSTQIVSFACEFSTLTLMEETALGNEVYTLEAVLDENGVMGSCETRETGKRTFEAEASFMEQLQQIVAQYDLAQFNGNVYKVSGLPDQFGAYLNVIYESEEQIYASNNQDCFLPLAGMEDLWNLFFRQIQ